MQEFTDDERRSHIARRMRNAHWRHMERMVDGTLYVRLWNRGRLPDVPDVLNMSMFSGMDFMDWVRAHPTWFEPSQWDEDRKADPFRLTEEGREALRNKHLYDMEPVPMGDRMVVPVPPGQLPEELQFAVAQEPS